MSSRGWPRRWNNAQYGITVPVNSPHSRGWACKVRFDAGTFATVGVAVATTLGRSECPGFCLHVGEATGGRLTRPRSARQRRARWSRSPAEDPRTSQRFGRGVRRSCVRPVGPRLNEAHRVVGQRFLWGLFSFNPRLWVPPNPGIRQIISSCLACSHWAGQICSCQRKFLSGCPHLGASFLKAKTVGRSPQPASFYIYKRELQSSLQRSGASLIQHSNALYEE